MALAIIDKLDWLAASRLERAKERMDYHRSTLLETKEKLPVLEAEYKQWKLKVTDYTRLYSRDNYVVEETGSKLIQHAVEATEDAAIHLREVRIELLGLTAKQEAIQSFMNGDKTTDTATLLKLDQLFVINEIERLGALARKAAYQEVFSLAKGLANAATARDRVHSQLKACKDSRSSAENHLESLQTNIKSPPSGWKPVEVYDNLIRIIPVRH